jgi:DNA-binding NtrC family response regulator
MYQIRHIVPDFVHFRLLQYICNKYKILKMITKEGKILIVDDNTNILNSLKQLLKHDFAEIKTISNPNIIHSIIQTEQYDVILLDMNFRASENTGNEGIYWLNEILKIDPNAIVILITAYGDVDLAVKAIKKGGTDFITKPWDPNKLIITIQSGIKLRNAKKEVLKLKGKQQALNNDINKLKNNIIGSSDKVKELLNTVKKVAVTDANILIQGENGTGKELIAREIHRLSTRKNESFVTVDMGSVAETLFESELFGHEKGAFTDAKASRIGRFEMANKGSLFLDEISNLPLILQSKILTVLEQRIVTPLGSESNKSIDIRLISATNKNLKSLVDDQLFREDLLYRLNTIEITVPPLRERGEDIIELAEYFVNKYVKQYQKPHLKINSEAYEKLLTYYWPGNIRELKHTVEKAVILCESNILKTENFFSMDKMIQDQGFSNIETLAEAEKFVLENALKNAKGNLSKAAKILDISRSTLYSKMSKYGL